MPLTARDFAEFLKQHGLTLCNTLLTPLVQEGTVVLEAQGWRAGEMVTENRLRSRSGAWLCRVRQAYTDNEGQVQFQLAAVIYCFNRSVALQVRVIGPVSERTRSGDDVSIVRLNLVDGPFDWLRGFEGSLEHFIEWLGPHAFEASTAKAKVREVCAQFELASVP